MTDVSESEYAEGIRIPQGYLTEFNFWLHESKAPEEKKMSDRLVTSGVGNY